MINLFRSDGCGDGGAGRTFFVGGVVGFSKCVELVDGRLPRSRKADGVRRLLFRVRGGGK